MTRDGCTATMRGRLAATASIRLIGPHTELEGLAGRAAEGQATAKRVSPHGGLLAEQAFRLVVSLTHARGKSCGRRRGLWLGVMALFASEPGAVPEEGLRRRMV